MIIDPHCHQFSSYKNNLETVINKAKQSGVKYLLTISTDDLSFEKLLIILNKYKNIFGTYGIHPHEAKKYQNLSVSKIKENLAKNNKIIGIGETGFDFHYNHSDKESQENNFLKHIEASQQTNKTLIVHSRSAESETFQLLNKCFKKKQFKILMHCFTGSKEFAKKLLDLGCLFSASGIVTFKNSKGLSDVFKYIPKNNILLETDSPFLSPEPYRGKLNEPSNIIYTLKHIAKIKKMSEEELATITSSNFFKLLKIKEFL